MKKILAADLFDGTIVRLKRGDYAQMTIYQNNPVSYIKTLIEAGVNHFHLVDLQGAKDPSQRQLELLTEILKLNATFQMGGGIRSMTQCLDLIQLGVQKIVIGTKGIEDPSFLETLVDRIGAERIIISLDLEKKANDFIVMKNAWQDESHLTLSQSLNKLVPMGLREILCTDISKDGLLSGPSLGLYEHILAQHPTLNLIASGGIKDKHDLDQLEQIGCHAAVIGTAFYENRLSLDDLGVASRPN